MATLQLAADVTKQFSEVSGCTLGQDLVDKCVMICRASGLDADALVAEWESFATNNNLGEPTSKSLDQLGDKIKRKTSKSVKTEPTNTASASRPPVVPMHRSKPTNNANYKDRLPQRVVKTENASLEQAYGITLAQSVAPRTPPLNRNHPQAGSGSFRRRTMATPPSGNRSPKMARLNGQLRQPASPMSPFVAGRQRLQPSSPTTGTPSENYARRTNMGKVEMTFNDHLPDPQNLAATSSSSLAPTSTDGVTEHLSNVARVVIKEIAPQTPSDEDGDTGKNLNDPKMYMYSTLEEKAFHLDSQIEEMKAKYAKQLDIDEFDRIGASSQGMVTLCGRICCEAEGKLNIKSLVLEGSIADCGGTRVELDVTSSVSELGEVSFFPGQIVVVQGMCTSKYHVVAKKIFTKLPAPRPRTPANEIAKLYYPPAAFAANANNQGKPVSITLAAGPYTLNDNLDFEPLEDLMAVVTDNTTSKKSSSPDTLVLLGPFVDAKHPMIATGNPTAEVAMENGDTETVHLTFEEINEMFFCRLANAMEKLPNCQLVLVPSLDDISQHVSFPQPRLEQTIRTVFGRNAPNVTLLPNPCTFKVNEIVVGITTHDSLFDLTQEDAVVVPPGQMKKERMVRLAGHMLNQASYYPMFPPAPNAKVDFTHRKHFEMPVTPDVFVCVSRLNAFVKNIDGTLVMNPGKLCKGAMGGTYSQFTVLPLDRSNLQSEDTITHDVAQRSKVKLVRI